MHSDEELRAKKGGERARRILTLERLSNKYLWSGGADSVVSSSTATLSTPKTRYPPSTCRSDRHLSRRLTARGGTKRHVGGRVRRQRFRRVERAQSSRGPGRAGRERQPRRRPPPRTSPMRRGLGGSSGRPATPSNQRATPRRCKASRRRTTKAPQQQQQQQQQRRRLRPQRRRNISGLRRRITSSAQSSPLNWGRTPAAIHPPLPRPFLRRVPFPFPKLRRWWSALGRLPCHSWTRRGRRR